MSKKDVNDGLFSDSLNEQLNKTEADNQEIDPVEVIVLNQLMGASEEVRNAPKVRVIIHNQEGPSGDQPVFVSVNGMGYSIPREIPTLIPKPILEALQNAAEVKYYREQTGEQQFGPVMERYVNRFPFSIV